MQTIIARTIKGSVCGFEKKLGKGSVIHLGTWIGFDTEGHKPVYEAILQRSGAKLRQASSGNENIVVRERFTGEGSAVIFIGNYFNEEQTGHITYTHPGNGDSISIPYAGGDNLWPALYGVLTPVCMKIADGLEILHCTSDILGILEKDGGLEITLFGDRDLQGEIVFEGERVDRVRSASIYGAEVNLDRLENRIVLRYCHKHREEIILSLK